MIFGKTKSVELEPHQVSNLIQEPHPSSLQDKRQCHKLNINYTDAYLDGVNGHFSLLENDFNRQEDLHEQDVGQFENDPKWSQAKRDRVKRFRFVVCLLALAGLALSLMSRMILNVAVVEMVKTTPVAVVESIHEEIENDSNETLITTTVVPIEYVTTTNDSTPIDSNDDYVDEDGLHFSWSKSQVNTLLASFYAGYAPAMLFSGSIANRYGAKYPLLICMTGSSIINLLTPTIARYSYETLVASRILMGLLQGPVFPGLYDLFNKWLTATESSIFAPMAKVSMPMGALIGTSMPGILATLGYEWPFLFYIGSLFCILWSIAWYILSTSAPQCNRFVEPDELQRIMRKKVKLTDLIVTGSEVKKCDKKQQISKSVSSRCGPTLASPDIKNATLPTKLRPKSIPWLLIVKNPSVLALTLVKYTYNLGMDFFYLELAVYLRDIYEAPIETISMISSMGFFMQMVLITFVGWLAKVLVSKRVFGLNKTKWRKIFQGTSNFAMAALYFLLPLAGSDLRLVACIVLMIYFFWMLGAGGESLVAYDLSSVYPAAIMALAHSVSVLSGLTVPPVCSWVLAPDSSDASKWNTLFVILGSVLALGGLVFVVVLEAKPFLPEEQAGVARESALRRRARA